MTNRRIVKAAEDLLYATRRIPVSSAPTVEISAALKRWDKAKDELDAAMGEWLNTPEPSE